MGSLSELSVRDVAESAEIRAFLRRREELGHDLLDEVWEGVIHLSPPPHGDHQAQLFWVAEVFKAQTRRYGLGNVYPQVGLRQPGTPTKGPRANFRVPDVVVLPPGATFVDGWVEDGALVVVEVRSPREVAEKKLGFYAARRVGEVLYVGRTDLSLTLSRRAGAAYSQVSPDGDGWLLVRALDLRVRRVEKDGKPALELEDARGGGPLPPP